MRKIQRAQVNMLYINIMDIAVPTDIELALSGRMKEKSADKFSVESSREIKIGTDADKSQYAIWGVDHYRNETVYTDFAVFEKEQLQEAIQGFNNLVDQAKEKYEVNPDNYLKETDFQHI
jgi:hypothetical protein